MTDATNINRRMLVATAALAPLLTLPGCAGGVGSFSLVEAVRRLLTLSSQRAFAALLQPGGFWDNEAARIPLPARLAEDRSLVTRVLTSGPVRDRLGRELNRAAERGAARAAPIVTQAIRTVSITNALAIVRGGGRAATDFLEGSVGSALIAAMVPAVGDGLRIASDPIIAQVLRAATGYDVAGLTNDVTLAANRAIWNAIGVEETAIRNDPHSTNDPVLVGVFGLW